MSTDTIQTINPATGMSLETYPMMTDEEAHSVVDKCHRAFVEWRETSFNHRGQILRSIGQALQDHKDELAELMSREMGKCLAHSHAEIDLCTGICEYTAEHGASFLREERRDLEVGAEGYVVHAPIGVVYGIQPWNFPAYQVVRYSIANLMTGNGVLLKHAEIVTGSALLLEKIYREGGLPENLFRVLLISHDQSDDIIANDQVRGVTFTGSPNGGRHVAGEAAKHLKKSVMELGSNDAFIVLADADLDLAVRASVTGRTFNNGETCVAAKRFIVVDELYDEFEARFIEAMSALTLGDPMAEETDIGPMAREDLRDTLHQQVEKSVANGARLALGGQMPEGDGFFYPATVLADVVPGQPAYEEEFFGPVASLIRAKDTDDAMRIANDSRFGLGGGIFSTDTDEAKRLAAEHFDTGMVFINGYGVAQPNMPFGGVKDSGYGREHGGTGVREFANEKAIFVMNGAILG